MNAFRPLTIGPAADTPAAQAQPGTAYVAETGLLRGIYAFQPIHFIPSLSELSVEYKRVFVLCICLKVEKGAAGTADEIRAVVDYMAKRFSGN